MTRVRCILVETTVPVRIRPRIETIPVKGHFLSAAQTVSNRPMTKYKPVMLIVERSVASSTYCKRAKKDIPM